MSTKKKIHTHIPNYSKLNVYQLIHIFNNKFLRTLEEYHSINEVMNYYNVPLFTSFDFDKKYNIITKNNMHFIKLRFDNISEFDQILSSVFQTTITMHKDNITNTKPIYSLYQQFKSKYLLPKNYLTEHLINDSQFYIYNTPIEQQLYIDKWTASSYSV